MWKPNSATEMRMLVLALRVSPVAPGHGDLNSSRYQSTILCQDVLSGEEEGKTWKCWCFIYLFFCPSDLPKLQPAAEALGTCLMSQCCFPVSQKLLKGDYVL